MKLTMTFEVEGTMEERKLEIPTRWLERIDEEHPNRPAINAWLKRREEILKPEEGRYEFAAQAAYDMEMISKLPREELDSMWAELRILILDVAKDDKWPPDNKHQLSGWFDDIAIPEELRSIIKRIEDEGPHRVSAPDAHLRLLAKILDPIGEELADGPLREYEMNTYCDMLRGDVVQNADFLDDDNDDEDDEDDELDDSIMDQCVDALKDDEE